tara:strand:+ start:21681 stop:22490 length:810 start_codon:yes stop_codon:yes gene_type:complete
MSFKTPTIEEKLGEEYNGHEVFKRLEGYIGFYRLISFGVMNWINFGTSVTNIDTYMFSSIQGTFESIQMVLKKGRINDAYSLLRKLYDVVVININISIYLEENFDLENLKVKEIDKWVKGEKQLPRFEKIAPYIKKSKKLKPITELLEKDERYKTIRNRCNDYTHYNFYHTVLANDNEIHFQNRARRLNTFLYDLDNIFIFHFAYIFTLHEKYMMSSDYTDYLDISRTPPEGSQYWIPPYIQDMFDTIVKKTRPDIAEFMLENTTMDLK